MTTGSASRWPQGHHLAGPKSTHHSSPLLSWVQLRPSVVAIARCVCRGTTGGRIVLSPAWFLSPPMAGGLRSNRDPTRYPGSTVAVSMLAPAQIPLRVVGSFTPAQLALRQAIPPQIVRRLRERVKLRLHNCLWCLELIWTIYSYIYTCCHFVNEPSLFSINCFLSSRVDPMVAKGLPIH